jgi:hypothetical protein
MTVVRARDRLRAVFALVGILGSCGAAPVAAQLQRGQLRLEVRDPAGAVSRARGEILSQAMISSDRSRWLATAITCCRIFLLGSIA